LSRHAEYLATRHTGWLRQVRSASKAGMGSVEFGAYALEVLQRPSAREQRTEQIAERLLARQIHPSLWCRPVSEYKSAALTGVARDLHLDRQAAATLAAALSHVLDAETEAVWTHYLKRVAQGWQGRVRQERLSAQEAPTEPTEEVFEGREEPETTPDPTAPTSASVEFQAERDALLSEVSELRDEAELQRQRDQEVIQTWRKQFSELREVLSEEAPTQAATASNGNERMNAALENLRDLGERTELLSFNASIESARAGEAGRGFAIVSDEVRKVSQRVKELVEEIHASVEAEKSTDLPKDDRFERALALLDQIEPTDKRIAA
jgi:vacuolar-type H+-ATPase subunit D/Vma8